MPSPPSKPLTRWQTVLDVADRFEPIMRREITAAIQRLRARLSQREATRMAAMADPSPVLAHVERELSGAVNVLHKTIAASGDAVAQDVVTRRTFSTTLHFDITNPLAITIARDQAARLVTAVTQSQRDMVRAVITESFASKITERETATLLRSFIGLNGRQTRASLAYRASLSEAGLRGTALERAVDRYTEKQLRARAHAIARTEIMAASNGGQHAYWHQAVGQRLLDPRSRRKWTVTPDDRLCDFCRQMASQIVGLSEPFVTPYGTYIMYPPLHTHCRCVPVLVRPLR